MKFMHCFQKKLMDGASVIHENFPINGDHVVQYSTGTRKITGTDYPVINFTIIGGMDLFWAYDSEEVRTLDRERLYELCRDHFDSR